MAVFGSFLQWNKVCHEIGCVYLTNLTLLLLFQNDDAPVSLMEMRFHIPSSELAGDDPVEAFHQQVWMLPCSGYMWQDLKRKKMMFWIVKVLLHSQEANLNAVINLLSQGE
jgi:hypothetical protein